MDPNDSKLEGLIVFWALVLDSGRAVSVIDGVPRLNVGVKLDLEGMGVDEDRSGGSEDLLLTPVGPVLAVVTTTGV